MMKKITISLITSSFFLLSCGNSLNEKSEVQTETAILNEHHHNAEKQNIEIDNGEKWKVDANMIIHIRNMENDIDSFAKLEQKDYNLLSEKLKFNIDLLTSNCTMKGKAHDELHKWLLPYIDLINELSEATDETEAAKQFKNVQNSFTTFNQYFQ